jgi:hypothetical protein
MDTIKDYSNDVLRAQNEALRSENSRLKALLKKLSLNCPQLSKSPMSPWQEKLEQFETLESVCEEQLDLTSLFALIDVLETAKVPAPGIISWDRDEAEKYFIIEWDTKYIMVDASPETCTGSVFYLNAQHDEVLVKNISFVEMVQILLH